ncbi:uncharacterized protein LOC142987008 isoform X1 [Anticarsia gemmatalis]|uniref:uncharacterized protein LOC142987008 isoform X1 n=1 Tax=Anticarsia gemmatalis TaxID=129554 RepID=UPI003F76DEB5
MDTDCIRKQVSADQLTALLEFLKEHQELAKGHTRGRRGKFHTLKLWSLCANKLNVVKDGAVKDGKGWSKYWCDWKYRVRRRALELKAAKDSNRPLPDGVSTLSPLEETILSIIGENAVDGVVIKSDPLAEEDIDEEEEDNNDHHDDVSVNQYFETQSRSSRKAVKRRSSKDHLDLNEHGGPSSPPEKKPRARENGRVDDSDDDDEASEFLRLEKEKLDSTQRIADSLQTIRSEISRLANIMDHIRDVISNNRIHL